jgi:hypothetical protein
LYIYTVKYTYRFVIGSFKNILNKVIRYNINSQFHDKSYIYDLLNINNDYMYFI